jgi:hypothetical protein
MTVKVVAACSGSFNDLLLAPVNGHSVSEGAAPAINRELESQRPRIYELAREIERTL